MEESHSGSESRPTGKVARLLREYDLDGLGDELEARWTAPSDERMGLREMAHFFNRKLTEAALQQSGTTTLEGEVENYYRLLTEDDVSSGTRVQARNRLEQEGIDIEKLERDFVSRQAIHTYLVKERDATYETKDKTDEERIDDRLQTIQRSRSRLAAVAERMLSVLDEADLVSTGETHVTVIVRVECRDCGHQYSITDLLSSGRCDCDG